MMSNDLYDRLLDYLEVQRSLVSKEMKKLESSNENILYLKGRYTSILDILSFLMTDGKLK